jgi:hypothetical protein
VYKSVIFALAGLAVSLTCSGQQAPTGKLPPYIRLSDGFTQKAKSPVVPGTKLGKVAQVWKSAARPETACGHIVVKPVTPEIDPKMLVRMPEGQVSKMPTLKGLPACEPVLAER